MYTVPFKHDNGNVLGVVTIVAPDVIIVESWDFEVIEIFQFSNRKWTTAIVTNKECDSDTKVKKFRGKMPKDCLNK